MMRAKQDISLDWIRGRVHGYFINRETGELRNEFEIKNVTTYAAADTLAKLIGGDTRYAPNHMGFIYGGTEEPSTDLKQPPSSRLVTWATLASELSNSGVGGNVLISPLSAGPGYDVDGSEVNYTGNQVELTAHSGTRLEYGFPVTAPYADELADLDWLWQAMLLTRLVEGSTITYLPFARVSLKIADAFPQKPVNFELALFWDISFF